MSWLEPLVEHPIAIAISRTLPHSLWQAALASLVLAIILRAARSSDVRYLAACGTLFAIVACSAITFVYVFPRATQSVQLAELATPAVAVPEGLDTPAEASPGLRLDDILPWLSPLWAAGVVFFSLSQLASWLGTWRLRRRGVCSPPEEWLDRLDKVRIRLGIRPHIDLIESCFAKVPVVIGHVRPAILLPIGLLAGLPAEQVELILIHELAHIRRHDYLVNMIQRFVEGLLFYNPFVWWISKAIRSEREHCCDDVVVSLTHNAAAYAVALAALEESRSPHPKFVLAASGGHLMKRIRRLLAEPETPSIPLLPLFAVGLLFVAATVVFAAPPVMVPPPPILLALPQPVPIGPAPLSPLPQAQQRWLEEAVTYIISDEERLAFAGLTSEEEREKFIEQFWLRRDPTPGTPENEFVTEYNARVAHANQNFSTPSNAGWKTDRGRILITMGMPDRQESLPATATTPAQEIWLYLSVGRSYRRLDFEDATGSGEFRLVTTPPNRAAVSNQTVPVTVVGAVRTPGIYNVRGDRYLLDILAMAQGLTPTAGIEIEIVRRKPGTNESETIKIDIKELFQAGRSDLNIAIQGDDVINVLHAKPAAQNGSPGSIFVVGEVNRPGELAADR